MSELTRDAAAVFARVDTFRDRSEPSNFVTITVQEYETLRQSALTARSEGFREGVEAAAKVCDGKANEARAVWDAYTARCQENPDNIGAGSTSWHQIYEGCATAIRALSLRETDESQETAVYIDGESGKSKRYELPTPRHPIRCKDSCAFPTFDLPCHGSCKLLASELPPPSERP